MLYDPIRAIMILPMIQRAARSSMRTTLAIDDDVLAEAERLAKQQNRSVGAVISDLARRSLPSSPTARPSDRIPLIPTRPGSPPVTLEIVNALRDEEP